MVNVIPETGKMWMAPVSQSRVCTSGKKPPNPTFFYILQARRAINMLKAFRSVSRARTTYFEKVLWKSWLQFWI